jgi:hypothetical protein
MSTSSLDPQHLSPPTESVRHNWNSTEKPTCSELAAFILFVADYENSLRRKLRIGLKGHARKDCETFIGLFLSSYFRMTTVWLVFKPGAVCCSSQLSPSAPYSDLG